MAVTVAAAASPPPPQTDSEIRRPRSSRPTRWRCPATIKSIGVIKNAEFTDEYVFQPMRIKVKAGATVTWTNDGKEAHDAIAQDGSWTTGEIAPGKTGTVKFDKPGTYTYICKDHPWSYGEIQVQ